MSPAPRFQTLISVEELALAIDHCVVVDCRHDLGDPTAGRRAYEAGHVPNAHFLGQDEDLASPRHPGSGRHPLPAPAALRARLASLGLRDGRQLVAYDDHGGVWASRLWWLARWLGHAEVAVLDGGLSAWTRAGYPIARGPDSPAATATPGTLSARTSLAPSVDAQAVLSGIGQVGHQVVDARASERFRGETEPLDPVAGHIPGAINRPQSQNLRPNGQFKPAQALAEEFRTLLGPRAASQVIHSCGSGISACHNLLAMEIAGLSGSALYPGSWSEWVADPSRPVATGPA